MICPRCRRSFYFLKGASFETGALCAKCGHEGGAQKPSYENYHAELYAAKPYRRTVETDPQMRTILNALNLRAWDVAVDLGCGVGDYTCAVHELTQKTAGYDRDVTAARAKNSDLNFFELDFEKKTPLPDASVDKIVSINVIEHLTDPDFFLKECRRILRPGGLIALSTANRDFKLHDWHYDATHLHEWTLEEFSELAGGYFQTIMARTDCAMFKYYPWNSFFAKILKPDLTWIGRKP